MEKSVLKLDKNHKLEKLLKKEILKCKTRNNKEHNGIESDSQINYIINIKTKLCECTQRKKKLKKHKKYKNKEVELPRMIEKEKHKVKKEEIHHLIPKIKDSEDRILPSCRRSTCIACIERKHNFKKNMHGNSARLCKSKKCSQTQKETRNKQKKKEFLAVNNLQEYYEDINSDEIFSGSDGDNIDKLICRTKEREKKGQLSKTDSLTENDCITQKTCKKEEYVTEINSLGATVINIEDLKEDFDKTTCFKKPVIKKEFMEQEALIKIEDMAENNDIKMENLAQEPIIKVESFEEEELKSPLSDLILIEDYNENITIRISSSSSDYDPEESLIDIKTVVSSIDLSDTNSIHSVDTLVLSNKCASPVAYSPTQYSEDLDVDYNDSL